jgi:ABC-type branched-subunit amino acid transport system ATPase component
VLVEHNFSLVLRVSDVVHLLANGALVTSGAPADIAQHPAILREYLGITEDALTPAIGDELGQRT